MVLHLVQVAHPGRKEEDWDYGVVGEASGVSTATTVTVTVTPKATEVAVSKKRAREEEEGGIPASQAKVPKVECDVSANFDISGLAEVRLTNTNTALYSYFHCRTVQETLTRTSTWITRWFEESVFV